MVMLHRDFRFAGNVFRVGGTGRQAGNNYGEVDFGNPKISLVLSFHTFQESGSGKVAAYATVEAIPVFQDKSGPSNALALYARPIVLATHTLRLLSVSLDGTKEWENWQGRKTYRNPVMRMATMPIFFF